MMAPTISVLQLAVCILAFPMYLLNFLGMWNWICKKWFPYFLAMGMWNWICKKWFPYFLARFTVMYNKHMASKKRELFSNLQEFAGPSGKLSLLELGCGTGANFKFYPPGCRVTCIDPNPNFEKFLFKRFVVAAGENTHQVAGCSMDVVVCTLVLCSVKNQKQILQEVRRVQRPVTVNPSLLEPLDLKVDPAIQQQKNQEKEEMKVLNDKFASLISKVQALEQRNQLLETRWRFLQSQDSAAFDLGHLYKEYQGRLQDEQRKLSQERGQLEANLLQVLQKVEESRIRYEEEIAKRTDMEFTFVQLKKDLDTECLRRTELETKLKGLQSFVELMKTIYEQELKDLTAQVKDVSVTVGMDSCCRIDLSGIVEEVKAQYDAIAARSLEEAEAYSRSQARAARRWTWSGQETGSCGKQAWELWAAEEAVGLRLEERAACSAEFASSLQSIRSEIADLNVRIQKLRSQILSIKSHCLKLEENIKAAEEQGELAFQDAKAKLVQLEEALQKAKQDMARQLREYQELMNTKLALDIEIATYRKLVEGEESRMDLPSATVVSAVQSTSRTAASKSRLSRAPSRKKKNSKGPVIKITEMSEKFLSQESEVSE
ncbi:keratin, type II cytoskeletal 80 [Camelus ferus]|nr:keratin, type II cytoskeletal 80 [Camelus ferus]